MNVVEAAKLLGVSTQLLRLGLIQNKFDFGVAIKTSECRYTYYINECKLREYLGEKNEIITAPTKTL